MELLILSVILYSFFTVLLLIFCCSPIGGVGCAHAGQADGGAHPDDRGDHFVAAASLSPGPQVGAEDGRGVHPHEGTQNGLGTLHPQVRLEVRITPTIIFIISLNII